MSRPIRLILTLDPESFDSADDYVNAARRAEDAGVTAVLHGDGTGASLEPTVLLARVAASTDRIGLIAALPALGNDPLELARRLADLDHVSGGRAGWRVAPPTALRRFGARSDGENARQEAEIVAAVLSRWNRRTTLRSPQGRPVLAWPGGPEGAGAADLVLPGRAIVGAGSQDTTIEDVRDPVSGTGDTSTPGAIDMEDARGPVVGTGDGSVVRAMGVEDVRAPVAEGTGRAGRKRQNARCRGELGRNGTGRASSARARHFRTAVRATAHTAGRDPDEVLVVPSIVTVLTDGGTGAVTPLPPRVDGHRTLVGTPEKVADELERWVRSGAADGFEVKPDPSDPKALDDLLDRLLPELRRRGLIGTEKSTLRERLGLPRDHVERSRAAEGRRS